MNKTLILVTSCSDAESASKFEQMAKKLYLNNEPKPCLTFLHKPKPHEVAEKAKKKKPHVVIGDGVSRNDFADTLKITTKRMNGNSPEFIQIGGEQTIETVSVYRTHEAVIEYLFN